VYWAITLHVFPLSIEFRGFEVQNLLLFDFHLSKHILCNYYSTMFFSKRLQQGRKAMFSGSLLDRHCLDNEHAAIMRLEPRR